MTTAPSDLSAFLRSGADWVDAGGKVHAFLWAVLVVFGLWFAFDIWTWVRERRGTARDKQSPASPIVDYATASYIVSCYIDPDQTMRDGVRLSVRVAILKRFEDVVGAKVGDNYNGELLHQWMQKNAARILVAHRGEMR